MAILEFRSLMPVTPEELYAWHARPGAFERLSPPWQDARVVERRGAFGDGYVAVLSIPQGPVRRKWVAKHFAFDPPRQFKDRQESGPFAAWEHTHLFLPTDAVVGGSELLDHIEYTLPMGALGRGLGGGLVRGMLGHAFRFRHQRTLHDLIRHNRFRDRPRLRVAITGASGMVGTALSAFLTSGGHSVDLLTRPTTKRDPAEEDGQEKVRRILWDPAAGQIDAEALEGVDAVVHLSGENIGQGRWTASRKEQFVKSRVGPTDLLCKTLAKLSRPPKVLVSASATGFYGDRGDEVLTEAAPKGKGFLADLCAGWEGATHAASEAGIRTVNLRIGVVLTPAGGAIRKMVGPFKMGVGGVIGSGRQYISWIDLDDLLGAIYESIFNDTLAGPVNATAPEPATNRQLTKTLGKALGRPTIFPMPGAVVKLIFGEMGDSVLLEGQRVLPEKLKAAGFEFFYPTLDAALANVLGREALPPGWGEPHPKAGQS